MKTIRLLSCLAMLVALATDTFGQGISIRSLNGKGTNTSFHGVLTSTNGEIIIGQSGFPITFGGENNGWLMTNHYGLYQQSEFHFEVPGQRSYWIGTSAEFSGGAAAQFAAGSRLELDYLTADRVMITGSGSMATNHPDVTTTELGYLDGVTSGIQAQIDAIVGGNTGGNDNSVQFNEGGTFAGTNELEFIRLNPLLVVTGHGITPTNGFEARTSAATNRLTGAGIWSSGPTMKFYVGNSADIINWTTVGGNQLSPSTSNNTDVGSVTAPWKNFHGQTFTAKEGITGQTFTATATPGTAVGTLNLFASNGVEKVQIKVPTNLSASVTHILGTMHTNAGSVIEWDFNKLHDLSVTSRLFGATSVIATNPSAGQKGSIRIIGELSSGAARVVTFVPHTGWLFINHDVPGMAPTNFFTCTVTNGNMLEASFDPVTLLGSNYISAISSQATF